MATTSSRKGLILALTCLAQFMVVLDIAIVNVALPSIQRDFDLRQSTLQWIVIAYGLMLGGFLLLGGRLGDLFGRRRLFLAGLTIFTGASFVAGIAGTIEVMIAARAVQGFGAALLAPAALSILAVTFAEGKERNGALGIFGAVGGSSASVGVIASGLLTDGPGWRWIFFINVPVGIALLVFALRFLPADRLRTTARQYDAGGAITVTGGLLLLVYGLNHGVDHGWSAGSTLGLFAASVVSLLAFIMIEGRTRAPLIPGSALRNRTMVAADLAALLIFGAFFAFIFLGSLLMQQEMSYSPTRTGVAWLVTSIAGFVAAGVTGSKLVGLFGVKRLAIVGLTLLVLGGAWLTRVPSDASFLPDLFPAFLLVGLAVGMSGPTIQIAALSGVSGEGVGLASGLIETMREIGGAIGIAAVSTVLVSRSGAGHLMTIDSFQSAFIVIVVLAALGLVIATLAFPRTSPGFVPAEVGGSIVVETAAD